MQPTTTLTLIDDGPRPVEVLRILHRLRAGETLAQCIALRDNLPAEIVVPVDYVQTVTGWLQDAGATVQTGAQRDSFDDLERLHRLHADGVLSEDEFAAVKQRVLNRI